MQAKALIILAAGAAIAIAMAVAPMADGERAQSGDIVASLQAEMKPHFLPRHRFEPITVKLISDIAAARRKSLPTLRDISFVLGGNGRIEPGGLPRCQEARIRATNAKEALAACGPALVGSGHLNGSVRLAGQEPLPLHGRLLMFNGRLADGRDVALADVVSKAPPVSFVLHFLTRRATAHRPAEMSARMPRVAGGFVQVDHISMTLGRRFGPPGRERGYLEASCAVPQGFTAFVVPVIEAKYLFAGGRSVAVTASRGCSVRG